MKHARLYILAGFVGFMAGRQITIYVSARLGANELVKELEEYLDYRK
jgi:hypothetical protein